MRPENPSLCRRTSMARDVIKMKNIFSTRFVQTIINKKFFSALWQSLISSCKLWTFCWLVFSLSIHIFALFDSIETIIKHLVTWKLTTTTVRANSMNSIVRQSNRCFSPCWALLFPQFTTSKMGESTTRDKNHKSNFTNFPLFQWEIFVNSKSVDYSESAEFKWLKIEYKFFSKLVICLFYPSPHLVLSRSISPRAHAIIFNRIRRNKCWNILEN